MIRPASFAVAMGVWMASSFTTAADAPEAGSHQQAADAVRRSLPLLEKSARSYPTHRKCFACHHQTLPLLGFVEARRAGLAIDEGLPETLLEFTKTSFRGKIEELNGGEGIGGKGLTVGYGLWTFRLGAAERDDLTGAMATYLLKTQDEDGHWDLHAIRPPAEESLVLCTVLAAAGVEYYAGESQREAAGAAIGRAKHWLAKAKLDLHEDQVARLWGCRLLGSSDDERAAAQKILLDTQRSDGGWSQTAELESDAYATGTALYVLLDAGLAETEPALKRAADFLVKSQLADGSWHVRKRAKPVQVFFDNGDPHGEDQFISISATAWSAAALSRSVSAPP